jgi:hypothetical protein
VVMADAYLANMVWLLSGSRPLGYLESLGI